MKAFLFGTQHIRRWTRRGAVQLPKAREYSRFVGSCLITRWEEQS